MAQTYAPWASISYSVISYSKSPTHKSDCQRMVNFYGGTSMATSDSDVALTIDRK